MALKFLLASKLSELVQFENQSAIYQLASKKGENGKCSHLPENSYLLANWEFAVLKWRKTCTGLKFDLVNFNGPQMKFKNSYPFEGPCMSKQHSMPDKCYKLQVQY